MSSWITNGLKTLRVRVGGAVGSVPQQRSPPHYGAQVKEVQIPPKPKKPLTPYFRFLGQVRTDIQKQNPNLKTTDLMKVVAQRWDQLDQSSKESYIHAYKNEMESYSSIIEKYKKSLTPEQIEAQQQVKLDRQLSRERREKKNRLKDLGKPKKPPSPFFLYLQSKVPTGSKSEDYRTAAKKLSEAWKTIGEAEKAPFVAKYKENSEIYEKSLVKWEDKMLKQGNDDLVRVARKARPPKSEKQK